MTATRVRPLTAPTLVEPGIRLRPWTPADAPALEPACGRTDIWDFTTVPRAYTEEAAAYWIARQARLLSEGTSVVLAVEADGSPVPVGCVWLFQLDDRRVSARLGTWVLPSHRERGLSIKGARMIAEWGLAALELDVVYFDTAATNAASCRAAEIVAGPMTHWIVREFKGVPGILVERRELRTPRRLA
jgi:RimJ/RimL family protein N-acetyltransferase